MRTPESDTPESTPLPTSPASVMSHSLEDVEASVLIVGGGPHALAMLSALHERSLAYPQFVSENVFSRRVGFGTLQKIGTVCVMDPGQHFLEEWNKRFEALGIAHLRSPAFAHPKAYEPHALVNWAVTQGRTHELLNVPFTSRRMATTDNTGDQPLLYGLPTTALFRDFCASLEEELPHQWVRGSAVQVCKDAGTGKFRVRYTNGGGGGWVVADAVVLATGPAGQRNIPEPFRPFVGSGRVTHTEEFFSRGETVAATAARLAGESGGARLLVIGGGLTAAQAALAAVRAGSTHVVLRSRRPLATRAYDLSRDWLDQRFSTRLLAEFLSTPMEDRLKMVKAQLGGGSVPESYMSELHHLASTSDRLELQVGEVRLDHSTVVLEDGKVHVDGEAFDHVILATGSSTAPGRTPLYKQVEAEFALPTRDCFPLLDDELSWMRGDDLYVVGANAVLELGPGALNLMGAQRGAKMVAEALRDKMWSTKKGGSSAVAKAANQFSLLNLEASGSDDSGSSDESDSD